MNSNIVQHTARQLSSALIRQIALAYGDTRDDMERYQGNLASMMHFHDTSGTEIAWNDVQVISMYNAVMGENLPVPMMATEGYNRHYHTSEFDGGLVVGLGPHDHRSGDPGYGGFAFSIWHPGCALPQQPWAV